MAKRRGSPFITTGERVGNFIGWAFLISLAIHFLLAPVFPGMARHSEEQTVEKVSVVHKAVVKPPPTPPPPTPTPPPTPPPHSTPPPQKTAPQPKPLKLNVVHTTSNKSGPSSEQTYHAPTTGSQYGAPGGTGTATAGPAVAQTAAPGPVATPKPACKTPYQDATVVQQVSPEYPDSARELGLGQVTVTVQVTVSPTGSLAGEKIATSGGNMALDSAAMSAARQSTYAPKIVNCQPVTGDYYFKVTFDPNS